jgi:(1->4)-alpha-D-glucan 1-alpha-D-glucosylmutase
VARDIPLSTFRLQLTKDFGFDAAAALVPYLQELGVTHLYASPFLRARSGSTHGYDIVDHAALNPEFGGEAAFQRLTDALKRADLGLILDFVPNHMGIGYSDNAWWLDVLEWGRRSPHAASFDIAWELLPYRHGGGVLLPVLGQPYGEALRNGDIRLRYDAGAGAFVAWYFEHKFPINPQRYGDVIKGLVAAADAADDPAGRALLDIAAEHSDPRSPSYDEAPEFKRRIAATAGAKSLIARGLAAFDPGTEVGIRALHRLLERQHYRLAYWRVAVSGINYRRFFDINELAGVRVEHPRTFRAVHTLVARLIAEDRLQGLRIDHIDGLRDPFQYARRLKQLIRLVRGPRDNRPFPIYVEKILAEGESLPKFSGVSGTTGYEWLNLFTRVLVDERGLAPLDAAWREFTGERRSFREMLEDAKRRVLETMLASEFTVLTQLLARIAAGHYSTRDHTLDRLAAALRLFVLEFPIYRTYVSSGGPSDQDRAVIAHTIAAARARWSGPDSDIFGFLQVVLTLDLVHDGRAYSAPRIRDFTSKLQQFTGPMMAKSLEDTAFYRHHRLLAFNEVGGNPALCALSVRQFHDRVSGHGLRATGLIATATHDTKRGEDARMRILALAELADEWAGLLPRWRQLNEPHCGEVDGRRAPSLAHEYMIYQTLIGAWPPGGVDDEFTGRIEAYALKAAREGKTETSWINPDSGYEAMLQQFVSRLLSRDSAAEFLASFEEFAGRTSLLGMLNSLSQLVLKASIPGTPDFYQGTELWDLSLVDPDNRRPVDFDIRRDLLAQPLDWSGLKSEWQSGRLKLALTHKLLTLRKEMPGVFTKGTYQPIDVAGPHAQHVIAFSRTHRRQTVIAAVLRNLGTFSQGGRVWPAASLQATLDLGPHAPKRFRDVVTGRDLRPEDLTTARLFETLPVAVLRAR